MAGRANGETVDEVRAAIGSQVESRTAESGDGIRGPPEGRASINADFADEVQTWYDETKPDQRTTSHGYFKTGTTSEALKSIGARADNVYMRKYKIGTILEDHPEMDIGIIKQVPELLENPVLIMKSRTQPDSIVLLGDIKAANGDTVMAALQLTPQPGGNTAAEFSLVTSAYGRTQTSIRNLINNSELLYLDPNKNRTNNWLMQLRVQFPSGQPPFGPIGNIAYADDGVKITGKTLQELGGEIRNENRGKTAETTGRASAEVADRRSMERELQERTDAYQAASNRNDTEYDYQGELERIKELQQRLQETGAEEAPDSQNQEAAETEAQPADESAEKTGSSEMENAQEELLEVGETTVRNDTGTYIMKVRLKGKKYSMPVFFMLISAGR